MRSIRRGLALAALSAALGLSGTLAAQEGPVVLINAFEVPAGQEASTLRFWERARDFLKTQPGYIDTRMHRNIDAKGRFTYVNVAQWASPQAFAAANKAMSAALQDNPPPPGVSFTPGLFRVVAQ
jgi:heme oxygenase (mycobilin-producing)